MSPDLAAVKQARNYNVRIAVRKAIRAVKDAVKSGDTKEARALLSVAYKKIDTADKKNVLQKNTARRRKSTLAGLVANMSSKKAEAPTPKKKAAPKKASAKKAPAKKTAAKKEAPKKEEAKAE